MGAFIRRNYALLAVISYIICGILFLLFLHLLLNMLSCYRLRPTTRQHDTSTDPFVSLLVPARNEEAHIEQCVRSLLAQHYERLEVLVLDDHSNDATASIVQAMCDSLPPNQKGRLRLLPGKPLPPGWVGKNFACYQLVQHAQGDYLFFTDADTIHAPQTVRTVIDAMQNLRVDLLTAQSEYRLRGLAERLIMPLLSFRVFTLLPLTLVSRRPEPILSTGNGPLLCFHRSAYLATGGHQAIKSSVVEDLALARLTKAAGYRMAFVDAFDLVSCEMYASFADTWRGFSRTFFSFYSYSLILSIFIMLTDILLFIIPPGLLLAALFARFPSYILSISLINYSIAVLMRILLAIRFTRKEKLLAVFLCLLHPVAILLGCLILLNSMRWHYRKQGTAWKGRSYPT
jgi:chlorobactene glucosyltransferase